MRKKHNVVMLPTTEANWPNCIWLGRISHQLHLDTSYNHKGRYSEPPIDDTMLPQHIYFTSDEVIKEGDWFINGLTNQIHQAASYEVFIPSDKKIVATTDPALLNFCWNCNHQKKVHTGMCENCGRFNATGVNQFPSIPNDFIQAYIKRYNAGTPITEVMLEMKDMNPYTHLGGRSDYKIKLRKDNTVICHPVEERKFTKAELEKAYDDAIEMMANGPDKPFHEWFNQNYPS